MTEKIKAEELLQRVRKPEREIQTSVCRYLSAKNIPYSVTDAGHSIINGVHHASKVRTGWPDVTAVLPGGQALFIECKTRTGKVSDVQEQVHAELLKQGAAVIVARSLDDVMTFVETYIKEFHA